MDPKNVSRYIRPADVHLLDETILRPILTRLSTEMADMDSDITSDEWQHMFHQALLRGDLAIVIDDKNKKLGIVRTDQPPYASLLLDSSKAAQHTADHNDPLGIRRMQSE